LHERRRENKKRKPKAGEMGLVLVRGRNDYLAFRRGGELEVTRSSRLDAPKRGV